MIQFILKTFKTRIYNNKYLFFNSIICVNGKNESGK